MGHVTYHPGKRATRPLYAAAAGHGVLSLAQPNAAPTGQPDAPGRNLSPDQKKAVRKIMKATAKKLRKRDPKTWTQERLAVTFGVDRTTVSRWFTTDVQQHNGCDQPSARVVIPKSEHAVILARLDAGETQEQVAADYGVTQPTVSPNWPPKWRLGPLVTSCHLTR